MNSYLMALQLKKQYENVISIEKKRILSNTQSYELSSAYLNEQGID